MRKLIAALILLIVLSGCEQPEEPEDFRLSLGNTDLTVASVVKEQVEDSSLLPIYEDQTYTLELEEAGTLVLKTRRIDNGDFLVTAQLTGDESEKAAASLKLSVDEANRIELNDWDQTFIERPHDKNTGEDLTTQPIGLFTSSSFEEQRSQIVLGKQYVSTVLTADYENDHKSTVRVLENETKNYQVQQTDESVSLEIELKAEPGEIAESWFMVSDESFFSNAEEQESWITYMLEDYKEANGWLTLGGPMKKLPWSIEPYTKQGYGRNLGVMVDREAIDRFGETGERYYYNLMINSAADLYEYRKEKGTDVWETEYTSTWLKDAYGLTAPYIDTRHNEFIGLYLAMIGDYADLPDLKQAQLDYADYLLEQIAIDNVIQTENGFYIADYFSPYDMKQKTHASMNHVLGGANLLLDSYIATDDEKYLEAAKKIRTAIEDLADEWVRDTGDLWYQVNPDLTFSGNDYEQLTLLDLLKHQNKWEASGDTKSAVIDDFITSKTAYLLENDVVLIDEIQELLEEQGFAEELGI
ncbi:MAG: hypothetical protein AB2374_07050 [Cytobacillus gottheilii]|uniref:hypothetical protein n=1 Tax=Cytobacillus gottheilii TaxID=859144 RepID=UPI003463938B